MRTVMRQLHIWLSIPFGVVIAIICFSGAMLIFEREISAPFQRHYHYVESVGDSSLGVAEVMALVEPHLQEGQRITGITIPEDEERAWKVNLSQPKHAAIYVDQYSGEVLGTPERLKFFAVMFRLHRWLMDSRPEEGAIFWGKVIVGVSTLAMVVVLISGVVLWVPKSIKLWRNRSRIEVRKGVRRLLYDLHVVGGIYAVLLLLAMGLTGLTWSFEWYRNGFYRCFGVETQQPKGEQGRSRQEPVYDAWTVAYESVVGNYTPKRDVTLSQGTISVALGGYGNSRASDRYTFDTATGEILSTTLYADSESANRLKGWIYSVHVGSFGGLFTRILWFLGAMLGATLPLTGYYLWFKRKGFI